MAYMALYRKWRPMTFDEVVEQEAVVTVLRNAVITGRIAHAYLFCGTRGTGKTTMAKIFARAVNCLHPHNGSPCNECEVCQSILNQRILDVSEIDAASNNGVDNIRSIIEETAYAASVAKFKVFIIDEVHMLSAGAFNALLKTLEEPPKDVIFILATTEPNKLPVTILSRCQRYDFKRISQEGIIGRLEQICKEQEITYELPALAFIAQKSDGALRDAISLLDQTLASCKEQITLAAARSATGSIDKGFVEQFAFHIIKSESAAILQQVGVLFAEGRDPSDFIGELMQVFRNVLVLQTIRNPENLLYETEESMQILRDMATSTTTKELTLLIRELSKLENNLKWAVQRKILFEAGMLSICDRTWEEEDASVIERVALLEKKLSDLANSLASGAVSAKPAVRPEPEPVSVPASFPPIPEEPPQIAAQPAPEPPKAKPKAEPPKPQNSAGRGTAKESDELDWKEFLMNISAKGQASLSALVKLNSKGILDGKGNLILVFASPIVKDMIVKKDATELLSESASAAYGMPLTVRYAAKGDAIDAMPPADTAPQPDAAPKDGQYDEFDAVVSTLQELSKQEGFQIESK